MKRLEESKEVMVRQQPLRDFRLKLFCVNMKTIWAKFCYLNHLEFASVFIRNYSFIFFIKYKKL